MFITKKHLSRRTVLRGVGAAISLPLLDAMIPAMGATAKPTPQRLAFVGFPHGAVMRHWSPEATGKDYQMTKILEPLAPYRQHLTIVSGLRNKPAENPEPHQYVEKTWLTCVPFDKAGEKGPDYGVSADQLAARHIGQETRLPSLEITTTQTGAQMSWRTPTQSLPQEISPRAVFYRLFGQGDTDSERAAIVKETGSILDRITGQAHALQQKLGATDRVAVDAYLDSVREIERRLQLSAEKDTSGLEIPEAPIGVPNDIDLHFKMMFDLMALAFQADVTRVITFSMDREASMRTYNNLSISEAFHPLSHHSNDPAKQDRLAVIQNYHTKVFARFIDRMAKTQDGDGTLLDHSMVMFGSNMSDSNRHNHDPLPVAILGHAHGRIKGGQHLHYPQDSRFADLLLTVLQRTQIPVESIGDSGGTFAEV
ncbi:MAG TPA: DUF1552 domain-containing protein [Gammaproteobacteria bacterium]|jgi:hypothetical protein|nr:DUF1552 domain-containing protein [Gammaproteobacteria bacterium]